MVTHEIFQTKDRNGRAVYHLPEDVIELNVGGKRQVVLRHDLPIEEDKNHDDLYLLAQSSDLVVDVVPSAKMSKSKKNVVDPVNIVQSFGADTVRWFVLSDSPPERDVEWTAAGAEAAHKHLARVHRIASEIAGAEVAPQAGDAVLLRDMHKTIHDVTGGLESFGFNAAIARLYAFTNTIAKSKAGSAAKREAMTVLAQLMAPMTPHLAEDIWAMLGHEGLIATAPFPVADPEMLVDDTITLPIQINGKRRAELSVPKDMPKEEVEKAALGIEAVQKALDGAAPKKFILVPGRIVNVVV